MKSDNAMVDFSRKVVCILGVPFDVVDTKGVVGIVQEAAASRKPCFISTVNLNYIVCAREDSAFRDSLLQSQLCIADGMPIVWVARLLGLPIRDRISGATLFERLCESVYRPAVKVFFFGGAEGVAQTASENVNRRQGGVECVGYEFPGFGSIESLSDDDRLRRINDAAPDFVVVSIGANRGQAWIQRNRGRLTSPVISYLGAVVNFAAGTVRRAPVWMQRSGLEWLWRIKEEPKLWARYAADARTFAELLSGSVLPLMWRRMVNAMGPPPAAPRVNVLRGDAMTHVLLSGAWTHEHEGTLVPVLMEIAALVTSVTVDLSELTWVDASIAGKLLLLHAHQKMIGRPLVVNGASEALRAQFQCHGASFLLSDAPTRMQTQSTPIPKNT